ncbi:MAG: lipocalin [Xanthomonadales bacterium]|nr:lipocalin family protein [Gammaproteobacteria bacterium]NNK04477.1 lipocalin [Xanthomonadales bacterium]
MKAAPTVNDFSQRVWHCLYLCAVVLVLGGCQGIPDGAEPVTGFELDKYSGKWYEIARMDHPFERGLSNVTAEYSLRDDGGVRVLNRGYEAAKGKWKEAEGKAYFVNDESTGQLKVSFFGPFYASYNVIALDKQAYQWSLVVGPDTDYMWILSRQPELDPEIVDELLAKAGSYGFKTDELIFVEHDRE